MQAYRMNCLTWEDYQAKIKDAILILPVGSTEQHSSHLPLGVDAFLAENIALSLADKIGGLLHQPSIMDTNQFRHQVVDHFFQVLLI
ncbi:hypothetical protein ES705_45983 [subsurface metagenome]